MHLKYFGYDTIKCTCVQLERMSKCSQSKEINSPHGFEGNAKFARNPEQGDIPMFKSNHNTTYMI